MNLLFKLLQPLAYSRSCTFLTRKFYHLGPEDQVFIISTGDPHTVNATLHYASLWNQKRGPAHLYVIAHQYRSIEKQARQICPKIKLVSVRRNIVRLVTHYFAESITAPKLFSKIAFFFLSIRPNAISLSDHPTFYEQQWQDYRSLADEHHFA